MRAWLHRPEARACARRSLRPLDGPRCRRSAPRTSLPRRCRGARVGSARAWRMGECLPIGPAGCTHRTAPISRPHHHGRRRLGRTRRTCDNLVVRGMRRHRRAPTLPRDLYLAPRPMGERRSLRARADAGARGTRDRTKSMAPAAARRVRHTARWPVADWLERGSRARTPNTSASRRACRGWATSQQRLGHRHGTIISADVNHLRTQRRRGSASRGCSSKRRSDSPHLVVTPGD